MTHIGFEELSYRLLEVRRKAGLSQKTVADMAGISIQSVCKYERKKSIPTLQILCKIADIYGVSTDWLLGRGKKDVQTTSP